MTKTAKPTRSQECLDQIAVSLAEFRRGLERAIPDPTEREQALAATDEMARNVALVHGNIGDAVKKIRSVERRSRRSAKAEVDGSPESCSRIGHADGAAEALRILVES